MALERVNISCQYPRLFPNDQRIDNIENNRPVASLRNILGNPILKLF